MNNIVVKPRNSIKFPMIIHFYSSKFTIVQKIMILEFCRIEKSRLFL